MKALGYIRVSSDDQVQEGVSLDAQRARIATWCEMSGADLVGVVEDAGISGTVPLANRPNGFRIEALFRARAPEIDAVVVVRLDRLSRDAADALRYLKAFSNGKVGLVSIADRLDLSSPQGRAMAGMGAIFSELERNLIAQRTAEALGQLRATGRVYGSLPFGFSEDRGYLVPDETEQAILGRIVDLREGGSSYLAIANDLNRDGIAAKRGGLWYGMSVRSVLRTSKLVGASSPEAA
jgi:site-specific DNA recombinase